MRKSNWKKHAALLIIICILCSTSVFSINAAPKVKSKSVALNVSEVTIGTGDIVTLNAVMTPTNSTDTVSWSSSKKSVATVNKYGVVTALKEGTTTITVKTSSKKKAKCTITVKRFLTEKEVSALISQNMLSDESIKKMIADNTISEAQIVALIQQNSLSEDDIKKLIQNNTLSEDDVKKIAAEYMNHDSNDNADWQDGTELSMISNEERMSGDGITINKITIKKYHSNDIRNGIRQKYKYALVVEGTVPEHVENPPYIYGAAISITYLRSTGDIVPQSIVYTLLEDEQNDFINSTYTENNGDFILTAEQYGLFCDYDEYYINELSFECYNDN